MIIVGDSAAIGTTETGYPLIIENLSTIRQLCVAARTLCSGEILDANVFLFTADAARSSLMRGNARTKKTNSQFGLHEIAEFPGMLGLF